MQCTPPPVAQTIWAWTYCGTMLRPAQQLLTPRRVSRDGLPELAPPLLARRRSKLGGLSARHSEIEYSHTTTGIISGPWFGNAGESQRGNLRPGLHMADSGAPEDDAELLRQIAALAARAVAAARRAAEERAQARVGALEDALDQHKALVRRHPAWHWRSTAVKGRASPATFPAPPSMPLRSCTRRPRRSGSYRATTRPWQTQ